MSMIGDTRGGTNGFFGDILGSVADSAKSGADQIFNNILPVWAANELNVQREDQMDDETYNQEFAPPKVGNYPSTTESAGVQKTGLLFDNVNISGTALLGVAVAAVVGIAIAKL